MLPARPLIPRASYPTLLLTVLPSSISQSTIESACVFRLFLSVFGSLCFYFLFLCLFVSMTFYENHSYTVFYLCIGMTTERRRTSRFFLNRVLGRMLRI